MFYLVTYLLTTTVKLAGSADLISIILCMYNIMRNLQLAANHSV